MRCVLALVLAAALSMPYAAEACEVSATASPDSECVVMPREGVRGVWFRLDVANSLRQLRLEVPELRLQLDKSERIVEARDQQVLAYVRAIEEWKSVHSDLLAQNQLLVADARRARNEVAEANASRGAWYRHPALWFAAGALVTGAVGGAILILDE